MQDYDDFDSDPPGQGPWVQRLMHWAGALVSVALIVGLAIWGYRLAVRDVTGVPVLRALEGPMRVVPADPGGELAAHQGLAVNTIAAEGEAAPPPDRLVLAPRPIDLTAEDMPPAELRVEEAMASAVDAALAEVGAQLQASDGAPAFADPLAEEAGDRAEEIEEPAAPVETAAETPAPAESALLAGPRPLPRPERALAQAAAVAPPAQVLDIDPDTLAPGTRLVQLGAFDDAAAARQEWDRLMARFAPYLAGKGRVIQAAESGGRTFYRLRAHGFADEADARRFCSALLAEEAACIPVLVR